LYKQVVITWPPLQFQDDTETHWEISIDTSGANLKLENEKNYDIISRRHSTSDDFTGEFQG